MNIAIYGYGNLGKGVECAMHQHTDVKLTGIFTRRDPKTVTPLTDTPVRSAGEILQYKDDIDVLVICGGSARDLPKMTPALAEHFNVVDSFDTHAKIPEHFDAVHAAAVKGGHTALICAGWDPGLFSLGRLYAASVLPEGEAYTFWGRGVSQGHSDAIRKIDGVRDARQYTVPLQDAVDRVRNREFPALTVREKHRRECYVVASEGADLCRIEKEIKEMPHYFADYDTTVTFITEEEMKANHSALPHGGSVIYTGRTGLQSDRLHTVECSLNLSSNPEFTSSVLVAYARAVYKLHGRGENGCKTVFDIAPADLSPLSPEELRHRYL